MLAGEPWIDPRISGHVAALAGADGLLGPEIEHGDLRPTGLPWQEPDGGFTVAGSGTGRTDLHTGVDTEGRTEDRRSDFDSVYGDWEALKSVVEEAEDSGAVGGPFAGARSSTTGMAALRAAERDPGNLSDEHALTLMTRARVACSTRCAGSLMSCAGRRWGRRSPMWSTATSTSPTSATSAAGSVPSPNAVPTLMPTRCRWARSRTAPEEAWALGATEVCMQGGIDPELPGTAYFDLAAAVKARVPQMHVHAFSPMEILNGSARTGLSFEDFLIKAREAGLDTIPGTAAEILDDEVRWVLTKGKLPTATWIEIITTAHRVGLRSSSTMMYGHVDNPRHWVHHLKVLRRIQDTALDAGAQGFTEFVPLPFVHNSSPIYLAGIARPGPTLRENLAVHAMARILLHGRIHNIQTSWVKLGVTGTQAMLQAGANDLGGTLMEETISRMAGSTHGSAKTVEELTTIATAISRPVKQRSTTYDAVKPRA